MSFFGRIERSAVALQVGETLDAYEATMDAWLIEPQNLILYKKLSSQIELVRQMSSNALPSATGALTDLLLAHTDLTFIALQQQLTRGELSESQQRLGRARKRHQFTLSEMRLLCLRLSTRRT
jgi:hypothetical protein